MRKENIRLFRSWTPEVGGRRYLMHLLSGFDDPATIFVDLENGSRLPLEAFQKHHPKFTPAIAELLKDPWTGATRLYPSGESDPPADRTVVLEWGDPLYR